MLLCGICNQKYMWLKMLWGLTLCAHDLGPSSIIRMELYPCNEKMSIGISLSFFFRERVINRFICTSDPALDVNRGILGDTVLLCIVGVPPSGAANSSKGETELVGILRNCSCSCDVFVLLTFFALGSTGSMSFDLLCILLFLFFNLHFVVLRDMTRNPKHNKSIQPSEREGYVLGRRFLFRNLAAALHLQYWDTQNR